MDPLYNAETLPLLAIPRSRSRPQRLHFLDNLRASLTIILIFYHASTLVVWENIFILVFTFVNNASIAFWGLFFFVSGYSAALALSAKSDYHFFVSRTVKRGVPALLYATVVHARLFRFLSVGWRDVFGNPRVPGTSERLAGPVAYVAILLAFDYLFLLLRLGRRKVPFFDGVARYLWPSSRMQFIAASALSMTALATFIFFQLLGIQLTPQFVYDIPTYDFLGYDAPLSFLIAYTAGVNFNSIRDYLDMSLRRAYIFLVISLILPCLSIGVYFTAGSQVDDYIFGASFYAWLRTSIFFAISIPTLCIFTQASWATRDWGFLARYTYIQMFVNMIPVQIGIYFAQERIRSPMLQALVAGAFGVVISWTAMLAWVGLCSYLTYFVGRLGLFRSTY